MYLQEVQNDSGRWFQHVVLKQYSQEKQRRQTIHHYIPELLYLKLKMLTGANKW